MKSRIQASSVIAAGMLALAGPAVAQQPYPDLVGSWSGQTYSVTQGKMEHYADKGEKGPVFRDASWTLTIDKQDGSRFAGSRGLTEGKTREPVLGVIRADRTTILMVADDNTLQATLTGPDAMELCNIKVNPEGHAASCAELSRKR